MTDSHRHLEHSDALIAAAARLDKLPLLDTSDGSKSWYQMNHEEGVLTDADGTVLEHVRGESDVDSVGFSKRSLAKARDGGMIKHAHTLEQATSFGDQDLAQALCDNKTTRGMVLVVTAQHPIDGKMRKVRYTVDTRQRAELPIRISRTELREAWNRYDAEVTQDMKALVKTGRYSDQELFAEHIHRVVERVCGETDVRYFREVVE